jgi:hypothetical protein
MFNLDEYEKSFDNNDTFLKSEYNDIRETIREIRSHYDIYYEIIQIDVKYRAIFNEFIKD